jgi:cytochrome subunit of sulfide dehydrogenase
MWGKTIRRTAQCMLAAIVGLGVSTTQADVTELLRKCTICHGDEGISDEATYPSIAGIPVKVQADAMRAYRDGTRDCGPVQRMCKVSAKLTDEQIDELAQHFAAFPFRPADQPFDAEMAKQGLLLHEDYCEVCHGDNPQDAEKSVLHGQWAPYLRYALSQYRSGHRKQPPSMRRQTEKLSDEQLEALVQFYASYR